MATRECARPRYPPLAGCCGGGRQHMQALRALAKRTFIYDFSMSKGPILEATITALSILLNSTLFLIAFLTWFDQVKEWEIFWWAAIVYIAIGALLLLLLIFNASIYRWFFDLPLFDDSACGTVAAVQAVRVVSTLTYFTNVLFISLWFWAEENNENFDGATVPPRNAGSNMISSLRCLFAIVLAALVGVTFCGMHMHAFVTDNAAPVHNIASAMSSTLPIGAAECTPGASVSVSSSNGGRRRKRKKTYAR